MARTLQSATIVSVMPAMGKSFIAKKFPTRVRDLESSEYHWKMDPKTKEFILDENGNKIANENWPMNYIEAIKNLEKSGMYEAVLVSSHEDIRKLMAENGIKYANIYPLDEADIKAELLTRCVQRHSTGKFIDDYNMNFSKYVRSMKYDKGSVVNLGVDLKSLELWETWLFQR